MFLSAILLPLLLPSCRKREDQIFVELDTNHNHKLSLSELEEAVVTGLFHTYDTDNDNIITRAEWKKQDPGGDGKFMRQRDLNRDGHITREEALTFTKRQGFCQDVMGQADRNGNGTIDAREAGVWAADHPEVREGAQHRRRTRAPICDGRHGVRHGAPTRRLHQP